MRAVIFDLWNTLTELVAPRERDRHTREVGEMLGAAGEDSAALVVATFAERCRGILSSTLRALCHRLGVDRHPPPWRPPPPTGWTPRRGSSGFATTPFLWSSASGATAGGPDRSPTVRARRRRWGGPRTASPVRRCRLLLRRGPVQAGPVVLRRCHGAPRGHRGGLPVRRRRTVRRAGRHRPGEGGDHRRAPADHEQSSRPSRTCRPQRLPPTGSSCPWGSTAGTGSRRVRRCAGS